MWVEALIAFHARRVQLKKIQMSSYEWWNGRKSKLDFIKVLLTLWVKLGPRILRKKKKRKKRRRCFLVAYSNQTVKFLVELCQIWLALVKLSLN